MRDLPDDFQLDQLNAALAFVNDFSLAVDIGAHRGIWTKALLERFNKVIAIEPTDLADQIDKRATVIKAACGSMIGSCGLHTGRRNTGQTYVFGKGNIPVITLDSLRLEPTFVKIDVEGMETQVIKGGRYTIMKYRPTLIIEENNLCQRYGHPPGRASKLLRKWGAKKIATFHMLPEKDENRVFRF